MASSSALWKEGYRPHWRGSQSDSILSSYSLLLNCWTFADAKRKHTAEKGLYEDCEKRVFFPRKWCDDLSKPMNYKFTFTLQTNSWKTVCVIYSYFLIFPFFLTFWASPWICALWISIQFIIKTFACISVLPPSLINSSLRSWLASPVFVQPTVPSIILAYSRQIINVSQLKLKEPQQDLLLPISILFSASYLRHHLLVFDPSPSRAPRIL